MRLLACACAALALAGCDLYFDRGGDDPVPDAHVCGGNDAGGPPQELRNPETLECVALGGGGGGCDPACGPCPLSDQAPLPPWGVCGSFCEVLGEFECLTTEACRVAYDYDCFTGASECVALTPFLGCFPTAQTSPTPGACLGMDSWSCSTRSDCLALHRSVCDASTGVCWRQFIECQPEGR